MAKTKKGAHISRKRPPQGQSNLVQVRLLSLRDMADRELLDYVIRRQEDRIASAMKGDRPMQEYAEAQLRNALTKLRPSLDRFVGPSVRVTDVAVTTLSDGDVALVCRCWTLDNAPQNPSLL